MTKCKLGDILRIQHGYAFKSENYVDSSEYRLITLGNFADGNSFKYNDEKATYYGSDFPSEFILKEDDLIMPMTEQVEGLFGNTAFIPKTTNYTFVLNQRVGKVVYNKNKVDKYYLHYLLATNSVKKQLEARASGTRQRNISPENIYDIEVDIPDIAIQEKIGRLLYSLEEKQINNNKINTELETMAKTIYDYWFLQFEFPNEEGKPYKSSGGKMVWNEELKREIPEGWEIKKLKEIESNIITGKTPSTKNSDYYNGDIPFVTIGDIRNNMHIVYTEQTLSKEGAETQKNKYIPKGSICVSCIASPGLVGFTTNESQTNQQINSVVCSKEYNKLFLYFEIKDFFKFSSGAKTGNTFANMNKEDFSNISILYPSKEILINFNKKLDCANKLILKNSLENQELSSLRDFLLPLLMNGQVGFKEVSLAL
ncbi:restriction endonuclease subunit S [Intestinibacter bartlettii]|uniref:Restriction endonuclease subunit S n=1 Tax=Intestinibacter bartlettii TaxID=261299 RepID=A0ABS6DXN2_9FIRM|nr:restriction endonuclease subunit S [Intestinibacter bartlettii]MBU5336579.1 restriction endonuclease subunit S [Intestinibacter bartlettii]